MRVIFTQNCTMSVGNMTVIKFAEGDQYDLEGTALHNALADGRCIPCEPQKPSPEENKQVDPVVENKSLAPKKTNKKGK